MKALSVLSRHSGSRARLWASALVWAVLAVVVSQSTSNFSQYQLDVATTLFGYLALAQAWNILGGFGGQMSLGTSAFVGTGAYTAGLLELHAGVDYPLAIAGSAVAGGALAAALAIPLLRLRGDYFTIGTLAAALALQAWVLNWSFAGGSTGLNLPIDKVPDPVEVFQLACFVVGLAMVVACLIAYSDFGMRLKAVRDDEAAATGLGVTAFRYRLVALMISGVISGLAGGLIAMQQISFEPTGMLGINWTTNALLMTVVGGIGTVLGPVVGAVTVYYLLTKQLEGYQTVSVIIEGILLVVIVRFAPRGLWPTILSAATNAMRLLQRRGRPVAPPTGGDAVKAGDDVVDPAMAGAARPIAGP